MKISLKSESALRAIFDLAIHRPGERVKAAGIADRQSISRKLLEWTLSRLKMGGFISARRGLDGGYCLAKPSDQITVGEVLTFVRTIEPVKDRDAGPFRELWEKVDTSVLEIVDRATFAELVARWERTQSDISWKI
jgi:Rrf2 family protein